MSGTHFKNRCDSVRASLGDYLDGTLSRVLRGPLEAHLNRCEECREALRQERELFSLLGSMESFATPDEFASRVMTQVTPQVRIREPRTASGAVRRRNWVLVPAAVLLLVLVLGQLFPTLDPGGAGQDSVRDVTTMTIMESGRDLSLLLRFVLEAGEKVQLLMQTGLQKVRSVTHFERMIRSALPTGTIPVILLIAFAPLMLVATIFRLRLKGVLNHVMVHPTLR